MTDTQQTQTTKKPALPPIGNPASSGRLENLKLRADTLGIKYSANISADRLSERVNAVLENKPDPGEEAPSEPQTTQKADPNVRNRTLTEYMREEQMKLVRIRLTVMNPEKSDLKGEVFTVANEYLGNIKKFIPYGPNFYENGYHVPFCIYTALKERVFQNKRVETRNGREHVIQTDIPEFAIQVLPPLTPEELAELANDQRIRNATADD